MTEENNTNQTTPNKPAETAPPVVAPTQKRRSLREVSKNPTVMSAMIIAGALVAIAIIVIASMIIKGIPSTSSSEFLEPTSDGNQTVTQTENSITGVAEKVSPSVVSIITTTQTRSFYGTSSGEGAGTGIIVSKDGYVMTNNHVIEKTSAVSIVDHTGTRYDSVKIIGRDPLNDVAFLKIQSDSIFTPAEIGNSATLRIGQQVVAIGNALGQYSNTVTSGIVSGTGRPVTASDGSGQTESLTDLIQTDASINPGNSGGPLVNLAGQVIGINTAVAADANGIGFAIPINATKGMLRGVLADGAVTRPYIGVNYLSITPAIKQEYKLPVSNGAYIFSGSQSAVVQGGPADKAGLKTGDIITKIDDNIIGKQGSLSSVIGLYRPNESATITYLRDGKENSAQLTFQSFPVN